MCGGETPAGPCGRNELVRERTEPAAGGGRGVRRSPPFAASPCFVLPPAGGRGCPGSAPLEAVELQDRSAVRFLSGIVRAVPVGSPKLQTKTRLLLLREDGIGTDFMRFPPGARNLWCCVSRVRSQVNLRASQELPAGKAVLWM